MWKAGGDTMEQLFGVAIKVVYYSALATLTLIILFSGMLEKISFFYNSKFCEGNC